MSPSNWHKKAPSKLGEELSKYLPIHRHQKRNLPQSALRQCHPGTGKPTTCQPELPFEQPLGHPYKVGGLHISGHQ